MSFGSIKEDTFLNMKISNICDLDARGDGTTDDYDAANEAHTVATANGGTVFFPPGTYKLSSDLTINANVTLDFSPGAKLSIDSGKTVTINGHIADTVHQIFSGDGSVAGAPKNDFVRPEWWGAVGDGTTVCTSAIRTAIEFVAEDSSSIGTVRFIAGTYVIDASEVAVTAGTGVDGTWTFTNGSTTVTAAADGNATGRIYPGQYVRVSTGSTWYKVDSVTSDDEFELSTSFGEDTVTDTEDATKVGVKCAMSFDADKDGVRLVGEIARHTGSTAGSGTQLYFAGSGDNVIDTDTYGIYMAGCSQWFFQNIQFAGNSSARPAGGIFIESSATLGTSANHRFYNCDFRYFTDSCLHLYGTFRNSFHDTHFGISRVGIISYGGQLNTFIHCPIIQCTVGFAGSGQNFSFIGCDFEGSDQGIVVNATSISYYKIENSTGWLLSGLYFESMGDQDIIKLRNAYGFTIGPVYVSGANDRLYLSTNCVRSTVTNWDGDIYIHADSAYNKIVNCSGTVTNNDSDSFELNDILLDDGTRELTADWDVGDYDITAYHLNAFDSDFIVEDWVHALLDGDSQYFYRSDADFPESGITGEHDLTIQGWIYCTSIGGADNIVSKYYGTGSNRMYRLERNGSELEFGVSLDGGSGVDSYSERASTNANLEVGKWHHVAVTYDASEGSCTFYKDGIALTDNGNALKTSIADKTPDFVIGNYQGGTAYFAGGVYNVALFDDIRTAAEILASAEDPDIDLSGEDNIIGQWMFNDSADADYIDNTQSDAGRDLIPYDGGDVTFGECGRTPIKVLNSTEPQLRLTESADTTKLVDFGVDTSGDLTITPSGGNVTLEGTAKIESDMTVGTGTKCDGFVITDTAEVQTTDATQTTIDSLTLLDENTYHVEAFVVGVKSDGSARASYHIACTVYRTGAGNTTLQGAVTAIHSVESDATWDATFTVNGNDLRVSVTGKAATTIEWGSTMRYINMSN